MKRTVLTVLAAVALVFAAGVIETPADEGYQGRYTPPPTSAEPYINPAPVWHRLAQMSPAERANAVIDFEREEPLARDIEHLWNTGRYDRALELLPQLAPEEIGITWRVPIAAPESDWGVGVEVSTRDSVLKVKLATDTVTGNLFCALYYLGDGSTNHWSINISTNGGESWSETATWLAPYIIPDIALTIVSGHAYVGYLRTNANEATTRRYRTSDGTLVNFPGGSAFFTLGGIALPDTLRELALTSNAVNFDNRLFALFNAKSGQSRLYAFSTPAFGDTYPFPGMPSIVSRGLDLAWNYIPAEHPLVFSFIISDGNVRVWGLDNPGTPVQLWGGAMASNGSYTALAVWKDTLHVVFDQLRTSTTQVRYLVRYEPTGSWFQGGLGDTTPGFSQNAAATGEGGGGVAVTYWQFPQGSPGQCFRYRPGYRGVFTEAATVQQGLTTMSTRVPAIARVAPGVHGVVFYRGIRNGVAYFNRDDWTGIAEPDLEPVGVERRPTLFVRGTLELRPAETGELFDASGRRLMRLAGGTNDLRGLAPGVYFLGIEADGAKLQQKLILAD